MAKSDALTTNVRHLMKKYGIYSVTQLATHLKINQPTLHRMLTGEVEDPKYSTVKTIAEFFNVSVTDLMEGDLQASTIDADDSTLIRHNDEVSNMRFLDFPSELKTAVINAYKEIVIREAQLFPDSSGTAHQTARLENLAESLVKGFSKLIGS
ncbi:helix-turn-helix domain-containing protein [Xenorhabdus bovienii]|uniref:helix-turn-helix domain-containing protein n=1 Tax=Xenorhabdus bovienii TaxID=40576 RepID=UPI0023B2BF95|nr:helix-turn-helix transcriptional regulator [Xenorhabdus bovienii]MDE9474021.1 helix-turn-helix domain-containing protein [Xenorhabdus bovienii]